MAMLELPPLSLYIHIPWCVKKCPYCDFNSHVANGGLPENDYVAALVRDLQNDAELAQGRELESIFFGGGTPSLFSAASIETIIDKADQIIGIADKAEITLEANPGTFEQEKFRGYKTGGVNRLSVGVQSFSDHHLKALGRIHSGAEAVTAISTAQQAGFENINLDLMHGLPQQWPTQALDDIQQAINLEATHISWYQLTIEANTEFYSSPPTLPDEALLEEIQERGQAALHNAGFHQYEISAFAKPDRQATHNNNYWQFGDYLGIGAGAHGKITLPNKQQIIRSQKTRLPKDFLKRKDSYQADSRIIKEAELPLEFFMNVLRLNEGVPKEYLCQRTGLDFSMIEKVWEKLEYEGLTKTSGQNLAATTLGHQFLDTILSRFQISEP
jgi:putative oxygen-independent coproporphyrinogen III oxidase